MSTAEDTWGSVYYREKYEKLELERLRAENEKLRARLAELQKPQGHQEERVAEWLRERGYAVTRVEQ